MVSVRIEEKVSGLMPNRKPLLKAYSRRTALAVSVPMAVTDVLTYVAEYVGIAIGMEILGIPPIVSVPFAYALHVMIVYRRKYEVVEKIMLGISAVCRILGIGSHLSG